MALFPAYGNTSVKGTTEEGFFTALPECSQDSQSDLQEHEVLNYGDEKEDISEVTSHGTPIKEKISNTSEKNKSKKKSKKRKHESKSSRKHKNKSKTHKKKHRSRHNSGSVSSSDSESLDEEENNEHNFRIPTHNGKIKNILFEGDFRLMKAEETMYLDLFPDKNNSIFSNTHFSQVARYSRLHPKPLGMNTHRSNCKKRKDWKSNRYFSRSSKLQHDPAPVMKLTHLNVYEDYVPICLTYNEVMKTNNLVDQNLRDTSIKSQNKMEDSEMDKKILSDKDYWQNLNKSFNEKLIKDAHNVSLWLEFVDIQDKVLTHCFDGNQKESSKDKKCKLIIERKISVLDAAISKNPRALELYHNRLQLGERIWEKEKLKSEWNKLAFNFVNDLKMWHHYLIFYQTYFPIFHLDEVVKAYTKCSERLVQMQQGTFLSHKLPENITYELINITVQLCYTWYQGGFMERSIALFQALFELNLFCPPELSGQSISSSSKIDFFEAFWDSKAPRFGEKNSIGWTEFMRKKEPVIFNEEILEGMADEEDKIILKGGSKPKLWVELESSRESNHWLPWQDDPDYCEDLERMVSFSVIKKHLFFINSEKEIFYLAIQFLHFLGIPIPKNILNEFSFMENNDSNFFHLRLETLETLIETKQINDYHLFEVDSVGPSVHELDSEFYYNFISEIIQRLISISCSYKSKFLIILITFFKNRCLVIKQKEVSKLESFVKMCKKNIKRLLKQDEFKNNPEIYFEFACFDSSLGNYEEALKIHSATLSLFLQDKDIMIISIDSEILYKHLLYFVRSHLEKEDIQEKSFNEILNAICSVLIERNFNVSQSSLSSGQILRVKKKIRGFIDLKLKDFFDNNEIGLNLLNYSIALHSVLQLLTEGFNAAVSVFEESLEILKEHEDLIKPESDKKIFPLKAFNKFKENLYENYIWIVSIVCKKKFFASASIITGSLVRKILKDAVKVAPSNISFLGKLSEYQNWRDILCGFDFQLQKKSSSVLGTIFRLLPQIKKVITLMKSANEGLISCGHQLESILESAVSSQNGRNCPLLWRIYLRFISFSNPKKIRAFAYRALDSCPNSKCLYMDCVRLIPDFMPEILKMMGEKGIRVRLPLEELDVLLEDEKEEMDNDSLEKTETINVVEEN